MRIIFEEKASALSKIWDISEKIQKFFHIICHKISSFGEAAEDRLAGCRNQPKRCRDWRLISSKKS